jgi:hypothetical protein
MQSSEWQCGMNVDLVPTTCAIRRIQLVTMTMKMEALQKVLITRCKVHLNLIFFPSIFYSDPVLEPFGQDRRAEPHPSFVILSQ